MQEAAKDLVKAEEEAIGEEQRGEWREDGGVGEEGGPALIDDDRSEDEETSMKAEEGVGEEAGGACMEEALPAE